MDAHKGLILSCYNGLSFLLLVLVLLHILCLIYLCGFRSSCSAFFL